MELFSMRNSSLDFSLFIPQVKENTSPRCTVIKPLGTTQNPSFCQTLDSQFVSIRIFPIADCLI